LKRLSGFIRVITKSVKLIKKPMVYPIYCRKGDLLNCAKSFIGDEPFAVLLGDDIVYNGKPCLKQMIEAYDEYIEKAAIRIAAFSDG
jgi:hypothetical protein